MWYSTSALSLGTGPWPHLHRSEHQANTRPGTAAEHLGQLPPLPHPALLRIPTIRSEQLTLPAAHSCFLIPACCSPPQFETPAAPQTRALGHVPHSSSASSSGRTCAVLADACEARPSHAAHTGPSGREACSPTAANPKGTRSPEEPETSSQLPPPILKERAEAVSKARADG